MINPSLKEAVFLAQQERKQLVLLTAHRRESFSGGLERIFSTIKTFAQQHPGVLFYYPVHPNSHVRSAIDATLLSTVSNIILAPSLVYTDLIYLLLHAHWVVTDSGGIQEEAISLGKKVIVLRDVTERMEGVWEGLCELTGTNQQLIMSAMKRLYSKQLSPHVVLNNVYGDGNAVEKIIMILQRGLLYADADYNFSSIEKTQLQVT